MAFVPLHCESHYSPLGVSSCADLARRARALGYSALGLCDEGTIAGFHEFGEACRANGVRPIYGCRIWMEGFILGDRHFPLDFHIETDQGYRNLIRILTPRNDGRERGMPRRLSLRGRTAGLIVTLPPDGELAELVRGFNREGTEQYLDMAVDYFGQDLIVGLDADPRDWMNPSEPVGQGAAREAAAIVELGPGPAFEPSEPRGEPAPQSWSDSGIWGLPETMAAPTPAAAMGAPFAASAEHAPAFEPRVSQAPEPASEAPILAAPAPERPARKEIWVLMRNLAEFVGLPVAPAPRVYFAEPADAPAHVFLRNQEGPPGRGWNAGAVRERDLPALLPESEFAARFQDDETLPELAGELARRLTWSPGLGRRVIPVQDFERGFDPNSFLFDLVIRGAAARYGEITDEVKQRINREFEEVKTRNLAPFLLLYRQITQFLDEKGIARGVGRGATVASAISYCLGVTKLDPLHYRLAPQPLSTDEETFPPIRIEIPSAQAAQALAWLKSAFGQNHVAQIGRRPEMRRDQMIEILSVWAGLDEEEKALALAERKRRKGFGAAHRLDDLAEARLWKSWRDPALINDIAERLTPRPKSPAAAPGRWALSSEPLDQVIPLTRAITGERVTDMSEGAIDQLGAPRIEFAPHHLLNLLDRAQAGAAQLAPSVDFRNIPLDDRPTFELIGRGDTLGIPPLAGVTVRCLLVKAKPTTILQILRVKTDANRGRSSEKARQLVDDLSEVLLAYQLAYIKAHHPVAFFASAFSSAAENGEDLTALHRAATRRGIEVLPPDINLSAAISQPFGGKIRLGLLMVRQLSEKALDEILSVRLGGRFNSLSELCVGVSPKTLTLRVIHNLIAAGACDGFGQGRGFLSRLVARVHRRARQMEGEDGAQQISFFDLAHFEAVDPDEDAAADAGALVWDPATRAQKEREALGFSLSRDPFEDFPRSLQALKPFGPGQVTARMAGKRVWMAGLVTDVDADGPIAGADGARLVDLEGTAVAISPSLAKLAAHALKPATPALIKGVVGIKDGYPRIDAEGFWRMRDLEEQGARVALVRLDLTGENRATLKHLIGFARGFPGNSRFDLNHYPARRGFTFGILSRLPVFFCTPFYQGLCNILSPERIQLLDENKQFLVFARPRAESAGETGH